MSKTRVYYNSACPVCNAGIGAERRRMQACNVDAEWIDIHRDPGRLEEIGASLEFVRKRLHVVDDSGAVTTEPRLVKDCRASARCESP